MCPPPKFFAPQWVKKPKTSDKISLFMIWFCLVTVVCCCCQNKTFQLKINLSDGFSRTRLQQLSMLAGMGWKCAMAVMTMCIRSFLPDCLLHWCLSGPYWLFNLLQMGYQYSHTFKRQHIRFLHKQLTKLPMCKMHIHWEDTWLLFHFDLMTLNIVFLNGQFPASFSLFVVFSSNSWQLINVQ